MNNNQLPADVQERIKTDAEAATNEVNDNLRETSSNYDLRNAYIDGYHTGHIAGATVENAKAQPLVDLLELIKTLGPVDSLTIKLIDKRLKEWMGKDDKPIDDIISDSRDQPTPAT